MKTQLILIAISLPLYLFIGCVSTLGFRTTHENIADQVITTQGISATLELDGI